VARRDSEISLKSFRYADTRAGTDADFIGRMNLPRQAAWLAASAWRARCYEILTAGAMTFADFAAISVFSP
jgi:hypothetical protein